MFCGSSRGVGSPEELFEVWDALVVETDPERLLAALREQHAPVDKWS